MASSRPHERKISIVRVLIPEALGKVDVRAWRSTSIGRAPCRARLMAVVAADVVTGGQQVTGVETHADPR